MDVSGQHQSLAALPPGKYQSHCTCQDWNPDRPARSLNVVAITKFVMALKDSNAPFVCSKFSWELQSISLTNSYISHERPEGSVGPKPGDIVVRVFVTARSELGMCPQCPKSCVSCVTLLMRYMTSAYLVWPSSQDIWTESLCEVN